MMQKLTYLETLEAEKQEKIRAKKKALIQENQWQKRLFYIPRVLKYVSLITIITWAMIFTTRFGFLFWVSQNQTEMFCFRESKAENITPIFTCTLPKTGAQP